MKNSKRLLFVSGEVAPFAEISTLSQLARQLPEQLQESGDLESRIMMPRYGTISERRNDLHEVIRLSGTEVSMPEGIEELNVKVASIPGIRLQVYFMDNPTYFGRKALYNDENEELFEDNPRRALFFARSVLETCGKLGWNADIVHTFGWMSALVPLLLRTEYADNDLFEDSRVIYTPDDSTIDVSLSDDQRKTFALQADSETLAKNFDEIGRIYADGIVYGPEAVDVPEEATRLTADPEAMTEQLVQLYSEVLNADKQAV
jgi:starch synthase